MAKSLNEILGRHRPTKATREVLVIYHFAQNDLVAEQAVRKLLYEQRQPINLGQGRSILFHKAHIPDTEDHLHFLIKGAKIAAINQSGTAHDRSHGIQLQRWALDGMEKHFPQFKRPPDGLIETLMAGTSTRLLSESVGGKEILLSKALRLLAEIEAAK